MENPPKKFFRLSPGGEVRLRYSYLIKCEEVVKDAEGNVTELRCTYDPMSGGGSSSDGRRVKGVIHWVSAARRRGGRNPAVQPALHEGGPRRRGGGTDVGGQPQSRIDGQDHEAISNRRCATSPYGQAVQFERVGYFCPDTDSTPGHLVFNRTVTLKDSWAKINK